ncbi:unnamed protein product [Diatraea saccharalis]|uniref:MD-2-related lipid-recognition domain-containing protein n=1 Tax=Diatraea saccharalis TaxID=40085 RepID=A0A9P0C989_9NEOP|nr:unnamed protein product [Diatraea saccharalis]
MLLSIFKMFTLRLLLLIFVVDQTSAVFFEDCGSTFHLTSVYIKGCRMHPPCFVTVGEQVLVGMQFIADSVSTKLDQNVVLNINHVNLRPEVTPEQCESILCPVVANAVSSLTSIMSVPNRMALVSMHPNMDGVGFFIL